jgi:hypothetical protein
MLEKLKPCPCCGRKAEILEGSTRDDDTNKMKPTFRVRCSCGIYCHVFYSKRNAIKCWNRRVDAPQKWEAGSEPPNGWYAVMFFDPMSSHRVVRLKDAFIEGLVTCRLEDLFYRGCVLWGPIPEPEEE